MLLKELLVAKIGVDTDDNGPRKGLRKGILQKVPDGDSGFRYFPPPNLHPLATSPKFGRSLLGCADFNLSDQRLVIPSNLSTPRLGEDRRAGHEISESVPHQSETLFSDKTQIFIFVKAQTVRNAHTQKYLWALHSLYLHALGKLANF